MPSRLNAGTYNAFAGWIEVVAGHKPIKQRVVHLCAGRFPSPAPPGPHMTPCMRRDGGWVRAGLDAGGPQPIKEHLTSCNPSRRPFASI